MPSNIATLPIRLLAGIYQWVQALSLDVAAGAVLTSAFVATALDVAVDQYMLAALGMTVWLIYTFDHLMDAKSISGRALTFRHRLHQQHFTWIALLALPIALANGYCIWQLPWATWQWGLRGATLVGLYFSVIKIRPWGFQLAKEPLVALVYVLGVMLAPFSLTQPSDWPLAFLIGALLFGVAFANLLQFSAYELQVDRQEGHPSIARFVGARAALVYANLSAAGSLVAGLIAAALGLTAIGLVFSLMAAFLLLTGLFPAFAIPQERYRIIGDGVFLIPAFFLW